MVVKGDEESGQIDFFGVLKEVLELDYDVPNGGYKEPMVVLFRCVWFDVYKEGRGIKRNKFGTISVNTKRFLGTNEPFALASQVGQVYYVRVHNEPDWRFVIKTIPRNFFNFPIIEDHGNDDERDNVENVELDIEMPIIHGDDGVDDVILPRNDVPPIIVSANDIVLEEDEISNEEEEVDSEEYEESGQDEEEEDEIPMDLYDLDSSSD